MHNNNNLTIYFANEVLFLLLLFIDWNVRIEKISLVAYTDTDF